MKQGQYAPPIALPPGLHSAPSEQSVADFIDQAERLLSRHPFEPDLDDRVLRLAKQLAPNPHTVVVAEALCLSLHFHGQESRPRHDIDEAYRVFRSCSELLTRVDERALATAWSLGETAQRKLYDFLSPAGRCDYLDFFQYAPGTRANCVNLLADLGPRCQIQ